MSLPPPGPGVRWKDYEITTPSFQLTPIEKPDMSPFLIHMTGPNQLTSILKGEGSSFEIAEGDGYLQANIPDQAKAAGFDAKVVCFTESPTFALDFFRYKSYPRWQRDMRFGIGFNKITLVTQGARPVAYFSDDLTKALIFLYHTLKKEEQTASLGNTPLASLIKESIDQLYPLLFPLLENHTNQGFIWEREWRIPDPDGFEFSHKWIKVICCPEKEEAELRTILGPVASNITFVRSWREYDDVTDYLRRQQSIWRMAVRNVAHDATRQTKIQQLKTQVQQHQVAIHSLDSYKDFLNHVTDEMKKVQSEQERLVIEREKLEAELKDLERDNEPVFESEDIPF